MDSYRYKQALDDEIRRQNMSPSERYAQEQLDKNMRRAIAQVEASQPATTPTTQTATQTPITITAPAPITSLLGNEAAGIKGAAIPEEMKAALQMRKERLGGFTAPQLAAQRSQMGLQQAAAEKARQRGLTSALARSGVRGGAASAAQGRAAQLAAQERAAQAQELFLADVAQKEKALADYERTTGQTLGTAQKQQFMEMAADITGKQLGVSRDIAERQAQAIEKYGKLFGLDKEA